jgi:hypothetical protein
MGRNKKCSYRRTNFGKEMRKSTILKDVAQVQKVFLSRFDREAKAVATQAAFTSLIKSELQLIIVQLG